jgi:hypothetical protein
MKSALLVVFTAGMFAASLAWGCGVCVEDKMAATYDHKLVARALDRGHHVVFTELSGPPLTAAQWQLLGRTTQSVRGVMRDSVRTSKSSMGLSFEIDPNATPAAAAIAEINRRMEKQPIRLSLIRALTPQQVAAR